MSTRITTTPRSGIRPLAFQGILATDCDVQVAELVRQRLGDAHARLMLEGRIDIGAFEQFDIDQVSDPIRVNGSQPLIPPRPAGTAAQPVTASQPALVAPGPSALPAVRERPRWRTGPAARYRRGVVRP